MFDDKLAEALANVLLQNGHSIVFAESCTAGLLSASMARIPGVSTVLAGSAVVYQAETKSAWLNVEPDALQKHGAVSEQVSQEMAMGAMLKTPQATVAVSVTGHLGPDAPPDLDGVAWSTVVVAEEGDPTIYSRQLQLRPTVEEANVAGLDDLTVRRRRQFSAVIEVMEFCLCVLNGSAES